MHQLKSRQLFNIDIALHDIQELGTTAVIKEPRFHNRRHAFASFHMDEQ